MLHQLVTQSDLATSSPPPGLPPSVIFQVYLKRLVTAALINSWGREQAWERGFKPLNTAHKHSTSAHAALSGRPEVQSEEDRQVLGTTPPGKDHGDEQALP